MSTKRTAKIWEYHIVSVGWSGVFSLNIYKNGEEVYCEHRAIHRLKDVDKAIRRELNMPRKRIPWVLSDEAVVSKKT